MKKILRVIGLHKSVTQLTDIKYSIRIITRGKEVEFLPMVRAKGLFNEWLPIVKIENEYVAMPWEKKGGLTKEECIERINGYKTQLQKDTQNSYYSCEFKEVV